MAFLRTLLFGVAAVFLAGVSAFESVNITSHASHSHSVQQSRLQPTAIPVNRMDIKNNQSSETNTNLFDSTDPVADDRMALLSILVLCIGNILVWISSSTPASSYSPTPTSSYLPTPVKKRAPKAFRKLFPGYKRSKWKKIALFLSCLGVSATASGYGTLAISVSSSGAADSGSASNAVGALLTAAAIGRGGGAGEEKCTVEWCEKELNKIRNEHNEHVIAYIIEVILPQVKAGVKLIPIFIGLCPTPERRGHESLGGKGRRDATRKKTALSIRLLQALNCCLPSCMDGGFDSKNPDIPNVFWVNARETCTDNGDTCKVCKSWTRVLANSIGAALCILSKCVKHYGGRTVAANVAGVSVKAHYIFEYLQAHRSFDGLSNSGTHISKLGCKCRAWTTAHQCDIASSTLASIDAAFKPTLNTSNLHPRQHSFKWDWTILCSGMSIVMGSPPPLALKSRLELV